MQPTISASTFEDFKLEDYIHFLDKEEDCGCNPPSFESFSTNENNLISCRSTTIDIVQDASTTTTYTHSISTAYTHSSGPISTASSSSLPEFIENPFCLPLQDEYVDPFVERDLVHGSCLTHSINKGLLANTFLEKIQIRRQRLQKLFKRLCMPRESCQLHKEMQSADCIDEEGTLCCEQDDWPSSSSSRCENNSNGHAENCH